MLRAGAPLSLERLYIQDHTRYMSQVWCGVNGHISLAV
jgi:hypothetical protein